MHRPTAGRWCTRPSSDLVITPLRSVTGDSGLTRALQAWRAADADQQTKWAGAYSDALAAAPDGDPAKVAVGDYGPVPALASRFLTLAASESLEGLLTTRTNRGGHGPGGPLTAPMSNATCMTPSASP